MLQIIWKWNLIVCFGKMIRGSFHSPVCHQPSIIMLQLIFSCNKKNILVCSKNIKRGLTQINLSNRTWVCRETSIKQPKRLPGSTSVFTLTKLERVSVFEQWDRQTAKKYKSGNFKLSWKSTTIRTDFVFLQLFHRRTRPISQILIDKYWNNWSICFWKKESLAASVTFT